MNTKSDTVKKAFTVAFPYTIPTLAGFMFLGISYGVYMSASGFSFLYPMFMSAFIYAGSMEFITVNLLLTAFNPLQAAGNCFNYQCKAYILWNINAR